MDKNEKSHLENRTRRDKQQETTNTKDRKNNEK